MIINSVAVATAVVIVLGALLRLSEGAQVTTDCGRRYHEALSEAVTIKRGCGNAGFRDCCQAKEIAPSLSSGQYDISEVCSAGPFEITEKMLARCDMESDGGGWLVVQRRANNNSINFYRGWSDYEQGFGDLDSEFWYGLKNIHCLTTRDEVELRIDLEDESENKITWVYQQFRVAGPEHKYRLTIGQGEGTPGSNDAMAIQNGQHFTTFDQDNDRWGNNCARAYRGAWWYNACFHSNLNGPHDPITPPPPAPSANRVIWYTNGVYKYFPYVEMKIRPKTCTSTSQQQCQ